MRQVAHGSAYFKPQVLERIRELMKIQCSATRAAYQFMRETGHVTNQVKKHVKKNYMADLNQRYVADACGIAAQMRDKPSVIFGGKKAWRSFQRGALSKEKWLEKRNSLLYSRGDKTKKGNPNIRIEGDRIQVNDPSQKGLWLEGKVFIPEKFSWDPFCYDARLQYKDGKVELRITSEIAAVPIITQPITLGAIGVDCNPDGVALVETDKHGNILQHRYEKEQRIQFASQNKRGHDIRILAIGVVDFALNAGKPLVLEKLRFWGGKQRGAKFNRMASNFLHRKMLDAIKSRAARMGVEVVEVSPAYTSILGKLKYMDMYSLNNHTAAALVIARRGMGIQERQTFTATLRGLGGSRVNLEGRSREHTLKPKAWSWMQGFLVSKDSRPHRTATGSSDSAGIGGNLGGIPKGESGSITGRSRQSSKGSTVVVDERPPEKFQ